MLSLIADSIHNFTDGLTIAAAWLPVILSAFPPPSPSSYTKFLMNWVITLFYPKRDTITLQILKCQFMTAGSAFAGTLLGLFLQSAKNFNFPCYVQSDLPFSAGGFIYLALASIVPEILRNKEKCRKQNLLMFAVFLMGILLMTILD